MKYILIIFLSTVFVTSWGQDSKKKESSKSAVMELSKSLEENESDDTIAASYEKLAKELSEKGEYAKAEDYLLRAKKLYLKLNNKAKIAIVEREIAKTQEAQYKISEAINSYNSASRISVNKTDKLLNSNDANRLTNQSSPKVKASYIQKNIDVLSKAPERKEEKTQAYKQMAEVNIEMEQNEAAIDNLQVIALDAPSTAYAVKAEQQMASVYAAENQKEKAIDLNEKILKDAEAKSDTKTQIEQLKTLSTAYIEKEDIEKGVDFLKQAYDLAVQEGNTMEAKSSLELLVAQYKKEKDPQMALNAYADFLDRLGPLIQSDSALIDAKAFQIHEERITRLEKERELKDELIKRTNLINYILIGTIVLVLIFLLFIANALYAIKKKNKKIALQSLRREMNPHFVFNSLNSVNQFIAQNNELEANKYLSSYSRLMRTMMENSNKDFTSLSVELAQLKEYMELEYMRFHDKFVYRIEIDEQLDTDIVYIPNMLIQPQLENAIWHGLRYKESGGVLLLSIHKISEELEVKIDDNGIGLTKSKELKTKHQKEHKSRGLTNTYERISLLNSLYHCKISLDISEKQGDSTGVIVTFRFPLKNKPV